MGVGVSFAEQGTAVWGAVVGDVRNETVRVFVSVVNRKTALLAFLGFLSAPLFAALFALAEKFHVISDLTLFILLLAYVAGGFILAYDLGLGVFPSSRRVRRTMMLACDAVAERAGAKPLGKFDAVLRNPKTKTRSRWEWRIWKERPWPDMVGEEELLEQRVPG